MTDLSLSSASTVPTAAEQRRRGEDLGLEGDALEAFVKAGAAARHEARVKAAREALICVHGDQHPTQGEGDTAPGYHIAVAATLAVMLSRCRVGGHRNTGRDGGWLRYPEVQHLRPSMRGPVGRAWTAAIEDAAVSLVRESVGDDWPQRSITIRPSPASEPGLLVRLGDHPELWCPEGVWDAQWLLSLCTRVVDEIAQGRGPREDFGMGPDEHDKGWLPAPRIDGHLEHWGDLLNRSADRFKASLAATNTTGNRYEADPDEKLDADGTVLDADGNPIVVARYTAVDEERW